MDYVAEVEIDDDKEQHDRYEYFAQRARDAGYSEHDIERMDDTTLAALPCMAEITDQEVERLDAAARAEQWFDFENTDPLEHLEQIEQAAKSNLAKDHSFSYDDFISYDPLSSFTTDEDDNVETASMASGHSQGQISSAATAEVDAHTSRPAHTHHDPAAGPANTEGSEYRAGISQTVLTSSHAETGVKNGEVEMTWMNQSTSLSAIDDAEERDRRILAAAEKDGVRVEGGISANSVAIQRDGTSAMLLDTIAHDKRLTAREAAAMVRIGQTHYATIDHLAHTEHAYV